MFVSNDALEIDIAKHLSFNLPIYYSGIDYFSRTTKFRMFGVYPEVRYWLKERDGMFIAAGKPYLAVSQVKAKEEGELNGVLYRCFKVPQYRDVHGRRVLYFRERFPCFDVYDRMHEREFRVMYEAARADVLRGAVSSLNGRIEKAVSTIEAIMDDTEAAAAVRLQAAGAILANVEKFSGRLTEAEAGLRPTKELSLDEILKTV